MMIAERSAEAILACAELIAEAFRSGHKLLLFGNGGSASDAQALAPEFVNRFQIDRPALPAIALTTDTSALTSIGNDQDFKEIFARQVQALGREGDVVIALSTSGNSPNVLKGLAAARERGATTVVFTGFEGGKAAGMADVALIVPSHDMQHIENCHLVVMHLYMQALREVVAEAPASRSGARAGSRGSDRKLRSTNSPAGSASSGKRSAATAPTPTRTVRSVAADGSAAFFTACRSLGARASVLARRQRRGARETREVGTCSGATLFVNE